MLPLKSKIVGVVYVVNSIIGKVVNKFSGFQGVGALAGSRTIKQLQVHKHGIVPASKQRLPLQPTHGTHSAT